MEEVSEEAIAKEITEESDDMSFYDDIDEDEIKESVYDLVKLTLTFQNLRYQMS